MKIINMKYKGLSLIETVISLAIFSMGIIIIIHGFTFVAQFSLQQKSLSYISMHVGEIFTKSENNRQGTLKKPYHAWHYLLEEKQQESFLIKRLCFYSDISEKKYYFYKVSEC